MKQKHYNKLLDHSPIIHIDEGISDSGYIGQTWMNYSPGNDIMNESEIICMPYILPFTIKWPLGCLSRKVSLCNHKGLLNVIIVVIAFVSGCLSIFSSIYWHSLGFIISLIPGILIITIPLILKLEVVKDLKQRINFLSLWFIISFAVASMTVFVGFLANGLTGIIIAMAPTITLIYLPVQLIFEFGNTISLYKIQYVNVGKSFDGETQYIESIEELKRNVFIVLFSILISHIRLKFVDHRHDGIISIIYHAVLKKTSNYAIYQILRT